MCVLLINALLNMLLPKECLVVIVAIKLDLILQPKGCIEINSSRQHINLQYNTGNIEQRLPNNQPERSKYENNVEITTQ